MVKYKEYKIYELFKSSNGDYDIQQYHINNNGCFVVSSGLQNCGIIGKSDVAAKIFDKNTITVDMFGNVFFRDFKYKMVTHARVFSLSKKKKELNVREGLYLSSLMFFFSKMFSYSNMASWEKIKNLIIKIPITDNGDINYSYMEERISELEKERISELEKYLKVTNLENYKLTEEDMLIAKENVQYRDYRLEDVLRWQPQKEIDPLKINTLKIDNSKKYPFYGQATINNGIISYLNLTKKVLNNMNGKPTILIHSNNQNVVYLETPFYLKDGHGATSVLQSEFLNEKRALYIISSIKKVITKKFSYNEKATKIALKNTCIKLPINKKNEIDYDYMEKYITVQQKLAIKNVVDWRNKQINTTKQVVNNV